MIKPIFNYPIKNLSFLSHYYVTGHKNPDLDSVASAVATAYLAEKTISDKRHTFEPVAAGDINAETQFALAKFGIPTPGIKKDLRMTVQQVMKGKASEKVSIKSSSTISEFIDATQDGVKSLAVLDNDNNVLGMVSLQSLAKHLKDEHGCNYLGKLKEYQIPYKKVSEIIKANVVTGEEFLGDTIAGGVCEATCSVEKLKTLNLKNGIVIVEDREDIQKAAIQKGAKTIIVAYDENVSQDVINLAKENEVIIMRTALSSSKITGLLKRSVPITTIMSPSVVALSASQNIDKALETVKANKFGFYPVLDKDRKFMGLVAKEEILAPQEKPRFILVDHNNTNESPDGVEASLVDGIIDHHLATFNSPKRMDSIFSTFGANATNVARAYYLNNVDIPREMAGLLWCAIVSDTDNFKSPTTRSEDRQMADKLAGIAGIQNKEELIQELLSQNDAEILNKDPASVVLYDSKKMKMGPHGNAQIAQIKLNETDSYVEDKKEALLDALNNLDKKGEILGSALIITNKKRNDSYLLVSEKLQKLAKNACEKADSEFLSKKFSGTEDDAFTYGEALFALANQTETQTFIGKIKGEQGEISVLLLPKVVSRKEQVLPFIEEMIGVAKAKV